MMGIYSYVKQGFLWQYNTKDNSLVYIGKDSHIEYKMRHKHHMQPCVYNVQKINQVLQNNPNRYEYKEIFVFDEISQSKLNQLKMQQIALFNPKFNFTKGGEGTYCFKFSEESKQKMSERFSGANNPQYGKKVPLKYRLKMSKGRNTCGYYRVSKQKNLHCVTYDEGKRIAIRSTSIKKLEEKVKAKGFKWYKLEEVKE